MSSLLRAESVTEFEAWSAPELEGAAAAARRPRTVRELQEAEEAVWQQVREQARAEGLAAAREEIARKVAELEEQARRLGGMLDFLARPLARLDNEVEQQLAELAIAIARAVIRRELRMDPTQVIAVVRETVGLLPASARDVRVVLHPADAAVVREKLVTPQNNVAWTLVEDPTLSRGDCRVTTQASQVDARVESRLAAAIATLLGDERAEERIRRREEAEGEGQDAS